MKIIDKLIIIIIALFLAFNVDMSQPIGIVVVLPIVYSVGYLIFRGIVDEDL